MISHITKQGTFPGKSSLLCVLRLESRKDEEGGPFQFFASYLSYSHFKFPCHYTIPHAEIPQEGIGGVGKRSWLIPFNESM